MPITPEFFAFLVENRLHDSKPWFEAHREVYNKTVLEPLRGLVREMAPVMLTIDSELITQPAVGKTISRIFRDTRFSKDKSGSPFPGGNPAATSLSRSSTLTSPPTATPMAAAGTAPAPPLWTPCEPSSFRRIKPPRRP